MNAQIELTGYPKIDFYRKVVALTVELAPDHREYLSDGDLPADIEELYERVLEYLHDQTVETGWPWGHRGDIGPFDRAFYQGCLDYYVNGEPSVWEEDVNPTEVDLYTAFEEAGIKTPYTI